MCENEYYLCYNVTRGIVCNEITMRVVNRRLKGVIIIIILGEGLC